MKSRAFIGAVLAILLLARPGWSQASAATQEQKQETKKDEKKPVRPKAEAKPPAQEETKYFQLDAVTIDVFEKARDVETPNMTVVKPELFPLSIGTTIDTALERQAGLNVQRIQEVGSAMDDDSIKIRGLSGRRLKVLRDGRLLNTSGAAGGYFIDFTMIPLADVDRIEIVKGVGDARYGNSLGGILNLVPRPLPTDAPRSEVEASAASFGSYAVNVHHAYKPGAFDYSLTGRLTSSRGYLANGANDFGYFSTHVGYDFPFRGRLTFDLSYSRIKKGFIVSNRVSKNADDPGYDEALNADYLPSDGEYMYGGMGAYPEPGSWWNKYRWLAEIGYRQSLGRDGVFSLSYWRNHGNREAYNTRAALDRVFHKIFFDDRSQGFSASFRRTLGRHNVAAGIDYDDLGDAGDANAEGDFRAPFRNGNYVTVRNLGVYATTDLYLRKDRLFVTPGLRYMSYRGIPGPSGSGRAYPRVAPERLGAVPQGHPSRRPERHVLRQPSPGPADAHGPGALLALRPRRCRGRHERPAVHERGRPHGPGRRRNSPSGRRPASSSRRTITASAITSSSTSSTSCPTTSGTPGSPASRPSSFDASAGVGRRSSTTAIRGAGRRATPFCRFSSTRRTPASTRSPAYRRIGRTSASATGFRAAPAWGCSPRPFHRSGSSTTTTRSTTRPCGSGGSRVTSGSTPSSAIRSAPSSR